MATKNAAELSFSDQIKMMRGTFGPYLKTLGWRVWALIGVLFLLSFYEQAWTLARGWMLDLATPSPTSSAEDWNSIVTAMVIIGFLEYAKRTGSHWCRLSTRTMMAWSLEKFRNQKISEIQAASTDLFQKFSNTAIGERIGDLSKGNDLAKEIPGHIASLIQGIIGATLIAFVCPLYLIFFGVDLIFNLLWVRHSTPVYQKYENRHKDWSETKSQSVRDALDRYKEVHLNGSYKESHEHLTKASRWSCKAYRSEQLIYFLYSLLGRLVFMLVKVSFYLLTFYLLYKGEITPGTVYTVFTFRKDIESMTEVIVYITTEMVPEYANIAKRVADITNVGSQYYGTRKINLKKVIGLEIKGLKSSYKDPDNPKKEVKVLKGVSMKLQKGKKYALVGRSGCGKTTFVENVCRIQTPTSGKILVVMEDGEKIPIEEISRETLPSLIGMVSQVSNHLMGSFMDQFKVLKGYSYRKMVKCCKKAQIHKFIKSTKDGYHTQIGERGLKLSGGQRQRLAIALALMQDPLILIMDEATAAQDAFTQKEIFETLENELNFDEKIVILIAHRLSTITNADKIFALGKGGKIIEEGTSSDLFHKGGYYHDMVEDEVGALKQLFIEEYEKQKMR